MYLCGPKVSRVNNCGDGERLPGAWGPPSSYHSNTTVNTLQIEPSCRMLQKSMILKRLHVKLLNTLLIHTQYILVILESRAIRSSRKAMRNASLSCD